MRGCFKFKIGARSVVMAAIVLAGCGTPTTVQTNAPASVAAAPPFQPVLVTTLGIHFSPDGIWKIGVSEYSLDISFLPNGGRSNWSGISFMPDSHGWTTHPGWFVFLESKSRWWVYDGDRFLILQVETWNKPDHFSGATYFGTFHRSSGGQFAFRADFPCAVPIEVISRLPFEKQKDVRQHELHESAEAPNPDP